MAKTLTRTEIQAIAGKLERKLQAELNTARENERNEIITSGKYNLKKSAIPALKELETALELQVQIKEMEAKVEWHVEKYNSQMPGEDSLSTKYSVPSESTIRDKIENIVWKRLKADDNIKFQDIGVDHWDIENEMTVVNTQCLVPACDMYDFMYKKCRKALGLE